MIDRKHLNKILFEKIALLNIPPKRRTEEEQQRIQDIQNELNDAMCGDVKEIIITQDLGKEIENILDESQGMIS